MIHRDPHVQNFPKTGKKSRPKTATIAEDSPTLFGGDEKAFAARLAYHQRDADEELLLIETDEKMKKVSRAIGFLLGYGPEKLAWRIVSWLLFRER